MAARLQFQCGSGLCVGLLAVLALALQPGTSHAQVFSAFPEGGEIRVNTTTVSSQEHPSIAGLAGGGFVACWESYLQDGSSDGVYAQRYDADGDAVGGEFQVNTYTDSAQFLPSVAALQDSGFVVAWESAGQDGSGAGIYAQRYDAGGNASGGEFRVNAETVEHQAAPSVAGLAGGGFVVSWELYKATPVTWRGAQARRFDADGDPVGEAIQVTANVSKPPVIAGLEDGGFVVSWQSSDDDIYAQRYDADGEAVGGIFRVNTFEPNVQGFPSAAGLSDGGFVVTWSSFYQQGYRSNDIYAQRYDVDGNPAGSEFLVNSYAIGDYQPYFGVAALRNGGFVVTWTSYGEDGSGPGVYAQRYDVDGSAVGDQFRVSTFTPSRDRFPSVAGLVDGGFVVGWMNIGQDGDFWGIYAQRYGSGEALTINGTPGTGNDSGWHMLSSPIADATRADLEDDLHFDASTGDLLYTWAADAWAPSVSTTPLTSGRGFILYLPDDATDPVDPDGTIDLQGNGPATDVAVEDLAPTEQFELLGNPFASWFRLSALNLTANGFQSSTQIWDAAANSFQIVDSHNDLVSPWQGFFIERSAQDEGATSITFPLSGKTTLTDSTAAQVEFAHIGFALIATNSEGKELAHDEAVRLYLSEDATDGWDAHDATKLTPLMQTSYATLSFTGEKNGEPVLKAQESRPLQLADSLDLPLSFESVGISGTFTITWPDTANIPDIWSLTLRDNATGKSMDLRTDTGYTFAYQAASEVESTTPPSTSTHALMRTLVDSSASARFHLVLSAGVVMAAEGVKELPSAYGLEQNYPNPFRSQTQIEFSLPQTSHVELEVFDVLGRRVAVLASGEMQAGVHEATWEAGTQASGIYLCRLTAGNVVLVKRLVIAK